MSKEPLDNCIFLYFADLSVNSNNVSSMKASIDIPSSAVCDQQFEEDDDDDDDYYYYYNYYDCSNGTNCTTDYYYYYYYDLEELFGNCSKVFLIPKSMTVSMFFFYSLLFPIGCETIIATSVAQNIPEVLSFGLPENM